jgi:carbonic anhydrase
MPALAHLFENNRRWAERIRKQDPDFFPKLARQQSPQYLWIGCADSRVPANVIVDLLPGELFVHRNIANLVVHTDLNCLSVIQFAVEMLRVKHIIVCGHYGCGGVQAAFQQHRLGLSDDWLRHIQDVHKKHEQQLASIRDETEILRCLCELNVIEQVANVCQTTITLEAWRRGQDLSVHGWIYGLKDGLLRDLDVTITGSEEASAIYQSAIASEPNE